jgi:hypothetical protein
VSINGRNKSKGLCQEVKQGVNDWAIEQIYKIFLNQQVEKHMIIMCNNIAAHKNHNN